MINRKPQLVPTLDAQDDSIEAEIIENFRIQFIKVMRFLKNNGNRRRDGSVQVSAGIPEFDDAMDRCEVDSDYLSQLLGVRFYDEGVYRDPVPHLTVKMTREVAEKLYSRILSEESLEHRTAMSQCIGICTYDEAPPPYAGIEVHQRQPQHIRTIQHNGLHSTPKRMAG